MLDLIVKGGSVHDGSGTPGRRADVGVLGGLVVEIGDLNSESAHHVVDAAGHVVSPGFVDVHTHGDLLGFPGWREEDVLLAAVRQGVTTHIVGNCGFSVFPHGSDARDVHTHVESLLSRQPRVWPSLDAYRRSAEPGFVINTASLVGHGSARAAVGAVDGNVTGPLLDQLAGYVDQALRQGAVGLSSGLIYSPGIYSDTEELVAAARPLRAYGRPYVTHVRGETDMIVEAVTEAITVAEQAGVGLHLSHHKIAGAANWGRSRETLELIAEKNAAGQDITLDVYPYTASSTSLHSVLPLFAQAGGFPNMLRAIADADIRERIRRVIVTEPDGWENMARAAGWTGIRIARAPGQEWAHGLTLQDVAGRLGGDGLEALFELQLLTGEPITAVLDVLDEADVERVIAAPGVMIGSDGIPLPGKPHPRWAGSFVRILGEYVRKRGVLDLPDAIHRMSGLPAARFRLPGRGLLRQGFAADIVVFDPDAVGDRATFDDPLAEPTGVLAVIVNGSLVLDDGRFTGARAGRFLSAEHEGATTGTTR
ncbi:N-acyl-D-amino-acid deacylase family protein [Streptomyces sp. NPDC000880]